MGKGCNLLSECTFLIIFTEVFESKTVFDNYKSEISEEIKSSKIRFIRAKKNS